MTLYDPDSFSRDGCCSKCGFTKAQHATEPNPASMMYPLYVCPITIKPEAVDHPPHYGGADNPYEAIKVIEAWQLGFCLGNCVKYISRAGKKGDALTDLAKAKWYLEREIEARKKHET